ncbi:hypothetical protein [Gordonia sputi]
MTHAMGEVLDSLPVLREQAIASVDDLISLMGAGRSLGVDVPADDELREPLARIGQFDVTALADDAHRLAAAHRAVADQLHWLPEQQIRLDDGWSGASGDATTALLVAHQRRAESDLGVLRTVSESTSSAASGIDRLLRTWYVTVARCSCPIIAGVPIAELPAAVLTGTVPLSLVAADIASRVRLFLDTADTTVRTLDEILHTLNRATEGLDVETYPDRGHGRSDVNHPAPQRMSVDFSDNPPAQRDHDEGGSGGGAEREVQPSDRTVEHENVDVPLTLPQPDGGHPDSDSAHPDSPTRPAPTDTAPAAQPPATSHHDVDSGADLALAGDQ